MKTDTFLIKSPNLEIYQTDDLRKWIRIYLHACRSRNLAVDSHLQMMRGMANNDNNHHSQHQPPMVEAGNPIQPPRQA